jgi:hypothetical protein
MKNPNMLECFLSSADASASLLNVGLECEARSGLAMKKC